MGKVELTGPSGESMGYVNFKTAPAPPAPPPTIIRFGDVGVSPAGCPMCPVLDEEGVKKQQKELVKNAHTIERLEKADKVCVCRLFELRSVLSCVSNFCSCMFGDVPCDGRGKFQNKKLIRAV